MRKQLTAYGGVVFIGAITFSFCCFTFGCEQEQSLPASPAAVKAVKPAAQPSSGLPANHPPVTGDTAAVVKKAISNDGVLRLSGVEMKIPEGWIQEAIEARPMAPVAVFRLPAKSDSQKNAAVRITYFPGMKGMDDQNIDRWLGQITKADGKPATRDDAKIEIINMDNVRLTTVDVTGVMRMSSGMPGEGNTVINSRLIAAIVDHPVGPHFVKASGDAATIEAWSASINDFLKSTRAK